MLAVLVRRGQAHDLLPPCIVGIAWWRYAKFPFMRFGFVGVVITDVKRQIGNDLIHLQFREFVVHQRIAQLDFSINPTDSPIPFANL